jgi:hypothetical protein
METISTNKFLNGLLPTGFNETVIEYDRYWACRVKGRSLPDAEWDQLTQKICDEFGSNLMEIYSNTCYGVDFVVYLKKNNDEVQN